MKPLLTYRLILTRQRLTFGITYQDINLFCGKTDDDYLLFKASNGIEIISRSRMDIQTDRLWLLGCGPNERSGSMVFSSDAKRDKMFSLFQDALMEWVLTDNAKHFIKTDEYDIHYSNDDTEWFYYKYHKKVKHIEVTQWADVFVIAPCSANTLAKIANGICDNMLTSCARAWDFNKPFIIAPSMNTKMWEHPITQTHLDRLTSWGVTIIPPQVKELFCGDVGMGAMANIADIMAAIDNKQ